MNLTHAERVDHPRSRHAARRRGATVARLLALITLLVAPTGCILFAVGAAAGAAAGGAINGATERRDTSSTKGLTGSAVAVALAPARDVSLVSGASSDTTWVRGAVSVLGRVVATRGDTLLLAVSEGRGREGTSTFPGGWEPTTRLVPAPGVAVRVLTRAPAQANGAFAGGLLGGALVAAGIMLAIMAYCSSRRCMD